MRHLTDDELIDRVYGIENDGSSHLSECGECTARWHVFEQRHRDMIPATPVTAEFLAAQRRSIHSRLDRQPSTRLKWAPALVAACLLAVAVLVNRPAAVPVPHADAGDAQLFSEVYSMEQSTEPRAASPIHELFEDNQ
jgi:hypothetical protein